MAWNAFWRNWSRHRNVKKSWREINIFCCLYEPLFVQIDTRTNVIQMSQFALKFVTDTLINYTICFLNGPYSASFSFIFRIFKQTNKHYNFYNKSMWKKSIQYLVLGFELTTSWTRAISHKDLTRDPARITLFVLNDIKYALALCSFVCKSPLQP